MIFPNGKPTPTVTQAPNGPATTCRKNVWYCPCGAIFDYKWELDTHYSQGQCEKFRWRSLYS
jgi:hypothetical protein